MKCKPGENTRSTSRAPKKRMENMRSTGGGITQRQEVEGIKLMGGSIYQNKTGNNKTKNSNYVSTCHPTHVTNNNT